jgi:acyl carrier protein
LVKGRSLCRTLIIDGQASDVQEWFDTGDLVRADKTGYYIDGRISDIVFGDDGENLNPDFAEQALILPGAKQFCVLGDEKNQKLMLVVRIPADMLSIQKQRLREAFEQCNASLPASYKIKEVRYTYDPICEENAIKVSRSYLRRAIAEGKVTWVDLAPNKKAQTVNTEQDSEIKAALHELFAQILDLAPDEIADDAHFMLDLGGTSLDYFTLVGEINKRFYVNLSYDNNEFGYSLNDFEKLLKELL